ncbi:MAG: hypothetical protein DMG96_07970 [Acidobacteria bacterium]|nr:MAG: hypothetical protein DMG96_07970 [Acidobacteriota bacterium]
MVTKSPATVELKFVAVSTPAETYISVERRFKLPARKKLCFACKEPTHTQARHVMPLTWRSSWKHSRVFVEDYSTQKESA